jgi:transcriptional regulator with XRE-family HTH domain
MLPLELQTSAEVCEDIARRVRTLRVERGWTQRELASRADMSLETLRRFERTGRISLDRLVRIATVLDALRPFAALFALPPIRTLDDLERLERRPRRPPRRKKA